MKVASLLTILIGLSGCAVHVVRDYWMQPDGSYVIRANGNVFANNESTLGEARAIAAQICPNGYSERSVLPYRGLKPQIDYIVKCKNLDEKKDETK